MASRAVNLARIVVRLLRSPKGMAERDIEEMCDDCGDRTLRNYFVDLTTKVPELSDAKGTRVSKVKEGGATYWRLRPAAPLIDDADFIARAAVLQLATQALAFMRGTALAADLEAFRCDLLRRVGDQTYEYKGLCDHIDRKLYFLSRGEKDYTNQGPAVATVLKAVLDSHALQFEYTGGTQPGARVVHPLSLLVWHGALYLIARATTGNRKIATYSVDRLVDVSLLAAKFSYPRDYSPETFTEGSFGLYEETGAPPVDVDLVFTAQGWRRLEIRERRGHDTQGFEDLADGSLRMTFRVRTLVDVIPWVRSFGAAVTVVSPPDLLSVGSNGTS